MTSEQLDVGPRLAAARLQRGLAQNDVARRAGVAASYLSRIENGKVQPAFRTAVQIARVLGVGPDELVGSELGAPPGRGPCPVTRRGQCMLDLLAPTADDEHYTAREVRLIRRFAAWVQDSDPTRQRAMEVLLEDLAAAGDAAE